MQRRNGLVRFEQFFSFHSFALKIIGIQQPKLMLRSWVQIIPPGPFYHSRKIRHYLETLLRRLRYKVKIKIKINPCVLICMFGSSSLDAIYPPFHNLLPYYLALRKNPQQTHHQALLLFFIFVINHKRQREELNGITIQREDPSNS